MKEVIAKAIKNKFDKNKMNKDVNIIGYKTLNGDQDFYEFSLYHLLFGTDFIECLVGEEKVCPKCGEKSPFKSVKSKVMCDCKGYYVDAYTYHRSIMANIKDIEELKAYIRELI